MLKTGKDWFALIISLLIPHAAGAIGSLFTISAIPLWYSTLTLPAFAPPSWVFGPAWTTLYTLMGIALFLVWRTRGARTLNASKEETRVRGRARTIGLYMFGIQMVLNLLWSIIFFGMQSPIAALIDIILLDIFIALTIVYFYRVRVSAALLLTPYMAWILFATALNLGIVILN